MAISRNARRKIAKQRQLERDKAKNTRLIKAQEAWQLEHVRSIVKRNLASPKPSHHGNIRSCLTGIESMSHRGYVCRASGSLKAR